MDTTRHQVIGHERIQAIKALTESAPRSNALLSGWPDQSQGAPGEEYEGPAKEICVPGWELYDTILFGSPSR